MPSPAIRAAGADSPELTHAADLRAAVEAAACSARPGDRVLLSPACPSYDQFKHFDERGKEFCRLIEERFGE